jgi:hypothetical protein
MVISIGLFSVQIFAGKSERGGGERHRGQGSVHVGPNPVPIGMKKRLDNRKLSERKNTVFSYIMTIFALAARRGLFGGRDFFDDSANIV